MQTLSLGFEHASGDVNDPIRIRTILETRKNSRGRDVLKRVKRAIKDGSGSKDRQESNLHIFHGLIISDKKWKSLREENPEAILDELALQVSGFVRSCIDQVREEIGSKRKGRVKKDKRILH